MQRHQLQHVILEIGRRFDHRKQITARVNALFR